MTVLNKVYKELIPYCANYADDGDVPADEKLKDKKKSKGDAG
jgi:hypothetical protein